MNNSTKPVSHPGFAGESIGKDADKHVHNNGPNSATSVTHVTEMLYLNEFFDEPFSGGG